MEMIKNLKPPPPCDHWFHWPNWFPLRNYQSLYVREIARSSHTGSFAHVLGCNGTQYLLYRRTFQAMQGPPEGALIDWSYDGQKKVYGEDF